MEISRELRGGVAGLLGGCLLTCLVGGLRGEPPAASSAILKTPRTAKAAPPPRGETEAEARVRQLETAWAATDRNFRVGDEQILLKGDSTVLVLVARKGQDRDLARIADVLRNGKPPEPLIRTEVGSLYVLARKDMKPREDLNKLAGGGHLPPCYPVFRRGDSVIYVDGSVIVRLNSVRQGADLLADARALGYAARGFAVAVPGGEPDGYILEPLATPRYPEPFATSRYFAGRPYVKYAEPVFVVQQPEESGLTRQPLPMAEPPATNERAASAALITGEPR